jgi:hypothetical protein
MRWWCHLSFLCRFLTAMLKGCPVLCVVLFQVHEHLLNFIDVEAGSKVLISSRVKSLLKDGDAVEVQLPKLADAVKILMSAAASTPEEAEAAPPPEAEAVVGMCGRLVRWRQAKKNT